MRIAILVFYVVLFGTVSMHAYAEEPSLSVIKQLIDDRWQNDEPGGGIIIRQNGKTLFEAYRGLRNLEQQKPITAKTIFPYASNTKRFTATTILKMAETGEIKLDDLIGSYIPELPEPMSGVTIRQLLTHSSGIPNFFKHDMKQEYSTADHIRETSQLELRFPPGTKSEYSNNGYNLLGALIERVSGKSWHRAVLERVVEPLGLSSIDYLQDHIDAKSNLATGYWTETAEYPVAPTKTASLLYANGSFAGTLKDLLLWVEAFHDARIITNASLKIAYEKQPHSNINWGWTMGLIWFDLHGHEVISHDGSVNGVNTYTLYIPSTEILIVTGSNVPTDARELAFTVAGYLIGAPTKIFRAQALVTENIEPILGIYEYPDGTKERLFIEQGALFQQFKKQRPMHLLAAGNNIFFVKRQRHWFQIVEGADGAFEMHFHERGREKVAVAVKKKPTEN